MVILDSVGISLMKLSTDSVIIILIILIILYSAEYIIFVHSASQLKGMTLNR